jgi:hypothetical protein
MHHRAQLTVGVLACALLFVAALVPAQPARAWSNGVDGPNTYGTHDWVLHRAIKVLRARGSSVGWVKLDVALRATDDPDTVDGLDHASSPWWHVYDVWGSSTYGAAPEAARVWFRRAARRLAAGNERGASKALGILAHIVGDVANPLHTDQVPVEELLHSDYEHDVDERTQRGDTVFRFRYDGRDHARPGARVRSVAHQAHASYSELVTGYDLNGYNANVHSITRVALNRGANAVADLAARIRAVSRNLSGGGGTGGSSGGGGGGGGGCDPAYPSVCIPSPPPDLDCGQISHKNFTVKSADPHRFDSDGDGVGCEG